tara:strand:- start:561 stop:668 length:108 start_codon:yes stop_codon:yes gene_type:complete
MKTKFMQLLLHNLKINAIFIANSKYAFLIGKDIRL